MSLAKMGPWAHATINGRLERRHLCTAVQDIACRLCQAPIKPGQHIVRTKGGYVCFACWPSHLCPAGGGAKILYPTWIRGDCWLCWQLIEENERRAMRQPLPRVGGFDRPAPRFVKAGAA